MRLGGAELKQNRHSTVALPAHLGRRAYLLSLIVVALLALGGAYAVAPPAALAGAIAGPNPDPPPPPPPPPAPQPPAPPPPPPPAYTPPPPPPPAYTPPPAPVHAHKRAHVKRHQATTHKQTHAGLVTTSSTWTPRGPDAPASLASTPVAAAVGQASSSANALRIGLACALLLSLLVVGVAAIPPWLVPRQVNGLAYGHREAVITGGAAVAVSIAIGLAIALLGS